VHPNIATGYAAYIAGDLAAARTEYDKALKEEPSNRDALLGIAALDVRAGRFETAEATYLRLLQADPRDSHAAAGLIALRAGRGGTISAESRVKTMLADNPGSRACRIDEMSFIGTSCGGWITATVFPSFLTSTCCPLPVTTTCSSCKAETVTLKSARTVCPVATTTVCDTGANPIALTRSSI